MLRPEEIAPPPVNQQNGVELQAAGVEEMTAERNAEEKGARAGAMKGGETKGGQAVEERRVLVGIAEAGTADEIRTDAQRGRRDPIPPEPREVLLPSLRPKNGNHLEAQIRPGN